MRRALCILVAAAALTLAGTALAAQDDVRNSKHNLSTTAPTDGNVVRNVLASGGTGADEICVFCHTPHGASTVPLWNRTLSSATYNMYNNSFSPTIDMTVAGAPGGVSAACLSCHDGTVGFDALINKPGSGGGPPTGWTFTGNNVTGNKLSAGIITNVGTDLTDDHPISVTYNPALDTAFQSVSSVTGNNLRLYITGGLSDQVECGSCHNPHNTQFGTFLRKSNAGSALCLTCHIK